LYLELRMVEKFAAWQWRPRNGRETRKRTF
jgi:hypothetical protein